MKWNGPGKGGWHGKECREHGLYGKGLMAWNEEQAQVCRDSRNLDHRQAHDPRFKDRP